MAAPILHHKSLPLRCFEGSPGPLYFNFFSAKDICTINFNFFTFINICFFYFRRRVAWSWHNIQRSTVSCISFPCCVVKFQAREANNSWRRSTSLNNPCNWVCVLFLFLSFLFFFFLPTFSIFSRSNVHRHPHNQGRCKETWKGRKETLESNLLHSICGLQINVWLGALI